MAVIPDKSRRGPLQESVTKSILDAAAIALVEHGPAASMTDVAKTAGVSRSTLYRYFPSREALAAALAESAISEVGERIRQARLDTVPIEEGLARLARAIIAVGNRYIVAVREGAAVDEEELDRELRAPKRALFERGQASGDLRNDLPVEWLENLFMSAGASAMALAAKQGIGDEETAANIVSLFLDGAGGKRPT